ncbi:MAG: recombination mediator RecR [Nitrospirota bacterium]|jgi:recombination protein RecR
MTEGVLENLTAQFAKLPGIGRKTAQKLAYFVLAMPDAEARAIAEAIVMVKDKSRFCSRCFNIAEDDLCPFCANPRRDPTRLCVVEEPSAIPVIERAGAFRGLYHVLLGALSPLDGVDAERLKIPELIARVREGGVEEVIIATNPNTRGEMTAQYIREALAAHPVTVTRIAYGLPMGGDIEFADEVTMRKSLEGRRRL